MSRFVTKKSKPGEGLSSTGPSRAAPRKQGKKRPSDSSSLPEEPKAVRSSPYGKSQKGKRYFGKFSSKWLKAPEFHGWLERSAEKSGWHEPVRCRARGIRIAAHRNDIRKHGLTRKHVLRVRKTKEGADLKETAARSITQQRKSAEETLAGFLAEQNWPSQAVGTLLELLPNMLPDSKIAQGLNKETVMSLVAARKDTDVPDSNPRQPR